MNKIIEALKKLLPAESVKEVAKAVEDFTAEQVSEVEKEYNTKLQEAYDLVSEELAQAEATAHAGYQQAADVIMDQQMRMEHMQEEFDNVMDEGFEEAWQMVKAEQAKNNNLEVEIYKEFDDKLKAMKDFMVEKLDQFMQLNGAEIHNEVRREILSDPRMVEHKVALDKIVEVAAQYLSEDDFHGATSSKLEETNEQLRNMKEHLRVLEARNVRLSSQNTRLQEQVRGLNASVNESTQHERKERTRTAKNVSGRGQRVLGNEQVIAEYNNPQATKSEDDQTLIESNDVLNDMLVLSGLKESD